MEITFLTKKYLVGRNEIFYKPKGIFKKIGTGAAITDFAIVLGGDVSDHTVGDSNLLKDRIGKYWTQTPYGIHNAYVCVGSDFHSTGIDNRIYGCRPAFLLSETVSSSDNHCYVCGEYPQDAVDEQEQHTLETLYRSGNLAVTGAKYTIDGAPNEDCGSFAPLILNEFEYNNRKFVRVKANFKKDKYTPKYTPKLSTGQVITEDDCVWIEVKPINWIVDSKNKIAFTEKILLAGIQFNYLNHYAGNFEVTDISYYFNKYFAKEIFPQRTYEGNLAPIIEENVEVSQESNKKTVLKEINPYNLVFDEVSEEDIIRGCVLSGITPYLHGKSSEGKSARIKQLDKDCEIIYLRTATPESLNGKSVYNQETGEMIDVPPTWYKRLKKKCEEEPDKIHILFLDELANALPAIQSMAFNLILDKEIDGKWKLPENARIVAAGNEVTDSIAANELAEPLFNRLAHVYIKTTVEDWLKWASTPDTDYEKLDLEESKAKAKIHPAIYAFISYKRDKALRTEYNGKTPNADPRKWELSSKVLYQTNKPEMLRALIGEELTKEFVSFCNEKVITLDDVLNDNYNVNDLKMNPGEKYATIVALSYVTEENLEKVRNFVKNLEPEYLALFDSLWTHGDESRLEIVAEIIMRGGLKK